MFQSSALLLFHYNCYSTATGISENTSVPVSRVRLQFAGLTTRNCKRIASSSNTDISQIALTQLSSVISVTPDNSTSAPECEVAYALSHIKYTQRRTNSDTKLFLRRNLSSMLVGFSPEMSSLWVGCSHVLGWIGSSTFTLRWVGLGWA